MTDKLTLGTGLIVLPVVHVVTASLYLWAWTQGFGARIAVLVGPADIFSVTLGDLIPVYLVFGISTFIGGWKPELIGGTSRT